MDAMGTTKRRKIDGGEVEKDKRTKNREWVNPEIQAEEAAKKKEMEKGEKGDKGEKKEKKEKKEKGEKEGIGKEEESTVTEMEEMAVEEIMENKNFSQLETSEVS